MMNTRVCLFTRLFCLDLSFVGDQLDTGIVLYTWLKLHCVVHGCTSVIYAMTQ